MTKLLTKHGNSYALIIERPIMDLLNFSPDTPLEIKTDGEALIVKPAQRSARDQRIDEAPEKVNEQYPKMMKRLAE